MKLRIDLLLNNMRSWILGVVILGWMAMAQLLGAIITVQPVSNLGFDVYSDGVLVARLQSCGPSR